MTATILAILSAQAAFFTELIKTQTPAVQLVMWQRYLELTAPLHTLLMKIEQVTPAEIAATETATAAAIAPASVPLASGTGTVLSGVTTAAGASSGPLPVTA